MCEWGSSTDVILCKPREISGRIRVSVDSCVADVVQLLNDNGIQTLGSCCGHGNGSAKIEFDAKVRLIKK